MNKTTKKHIKNNLKSNFDPFGSYTGIVSDNKNERPVQDVDDL